MPPVRRSTTYSTEWQFVLPCVDHHIPYTMMTTAVFCDWIVGEDSLTGFMQFRCSRKVSPKWFKGLMPVWSIMTISDYVDRFRDLPGKHKTFGTFIPSLLVVPKRTSAGVPRPSTLGKPKSERFRRPSGYHKSSEELVPGFKSLPPFPTMHYNPITKAYSEIPYAPLVVAGQPIPPPTLFDVMGVLPDAI